MRGKFLAFLLIFSIGILIGQTVQAQSIPNFSTIKVDDLSDAQIRQLMERVESMGYTQAQLEQIAAVQGMKADEVAKLKARVEKLNQGNKSTVQKAKDKMDLEGKKLDISSMRNTLGLEKDTTLNNPLTKEELLKQAFDMLKPKIFGADLFKNNNITFEPNLRMATPKGYVVGPDDELLIDLSGDNDQSYELKVSPDGTIRIEYLGPLSVAGLTIEQATSKIRNSLRSIYPSITSGRTNVAVNIGNLKSINVIMTGQLTKPGTYTLSSFSTVFNALYAAGGPNERGSYRKIQVIRNNKVVATVDVYDFILNGIQKGNIRLEDQDVINVPIFSKRVEVVGEVNDPAIFESVDGESLRDILNYAGNFSPNAYQARIKVFGATDRERRVTDIFSVDFVNYEPKNGDKYFVEPILDRFENRVEIEGAVFRPGPYALEEGLTLKQLIAKAEGVKEDAFMSRGYIHRLNVDNSAGMISFDLAKILSGAAADIKLQREDKVVINSLFDLREEYKITVNGVVRNPQDFDYAEGMTIENAIQMAGGFMEGATPNRIEISRRIRNSDATSITATTAAVFTVNVNANLSLSDNSFKLQPFDIISVRNSESYQEQKQVFIEGEVLYPGPYTITSKDERLSDLIVRAGGLTAIAYVDGASLKRPGPPKSKADLEKDAKRQQQIKEEEEVQRQLDLKRFNQGLEAQAGVNKADTAKVIIASDLVGINLSQILKTPGSTNDLILEEGDILRIPKQLQTVKVTGEVLNPNNIVYRHNRGFKNYINGAGGYSMNAMKSRAYIKYANGSVESAKNILFFKAYPSVKPGSEIIVPQRPPRERMNAQSWVGLGTAFASLAAIIVTIIR